MIGKNERLEENINNQRTNLLNHKRKLLEDTSEKVKEEVSLCFERLSKTLRNREKQLLRQIEAIHNQQLSIIQSDPEIPLTVPFVRVNLSKKQELEDCILKFGELSSSNRSSIDVRDAEPFKIEDYVEANRDHVTLDKFINNEAQKMDYPGSPCNSSFNTSSEADETSECEVTVLMNENYVANSKFEDTSSLKLSKEADQASSTEKKLLDSSLNLDLKICAQAVVDEEFGVPETGTRESSNLLNKNSEDSSNSSEKDLCSPTNSGSPLETDSNSESKKKGQDSEKHPKQIQEWLEQILVETETEPSIHEIEQFAEISKSRFREFQFPLET